MPLHIERLVHKLGARCIPLLARELGRDPKRRELARQALARLAADTRERVIEELRRVASSDACDEGKVAALGLLAELGVRGAAKFSDAGAIRRRSALALAAQLDNVADIAAAADMMIGQLGDDEIVRLVEVMVDASRGAAYHLAVELCARLDLAPETRERIADSALGMTTPLPVVERPPRPTLVAVLVESLARDHQGRQAGRVVVVASRKVSGERRWRRWAVLIGVDGMIDDCINEEHAGADGDHTPLVASLVGEGYRVATTDLERARGIVAAAARHSSDEPDRLNSAYYLGRDLLDLGEAHLGGRVHAHPTSTTLGRAVELIADDELSRRSSLAAPPGPVPGPGGASPVGRGYAPPDRLDNLARAQVLLARCADSADAAAAHAACLIAQGRLADAIVQLVHAIELEPEFPLHHWNLAATLHQLGDATGCYHALCRFLATSERPTGLFADPDQPARVALASRLVSELERTARLSGTPLSRPRRKRRARR